MLNFVQVKLLNFMSVAGEETVRLDVQGLTLVNGKNGAGKSTRYSEAVVWALFGQTIRSLGADEMINRDANSCSVVLEIVDPDGNLYSIRREKSTKTAQTLAVERLSASGKAEPVFMGANLAERQKQLENWLGIDYRTFINSVVFGQGLGAFFASGAMSDTDRKAIFDRIYGLDEYDSALVVAQMQASDLKEKLLVTQGDEESCRREIERLNSLIETTARDEVSWLDGRKVGRERLVEVATKAQTGQSASTAEVTRSTEALEQVTKEEREFHRSLKENEYDPTEVEQTEKFLAEQRDFVNAQVAQHTLFVGEIGRLERTVTNLEEGIAKGICPTCNQPAGVEPLKLKRSAVASELGATRDRKAELEQDLTQIKEDYDLLKTELASRKEAIAQVTSREQEFVRRRSDAAAACKTAGEWKRNAMQGLLDALENLKLFDAEENPHTATLNSFRQNVGELTTALDAAADQRKTLVWGAVATEFWVRAFGPKGIKAFMIESTLPELNRLANEHLFALTGGGFSVEIRATTALKKGTSAERLSVNVVNDKGALVYEGNSGGEKRRIDLAILLALQDLVLRRAKRGIAFSVFDEILDALDDESILRAVAHLQTRARSENKPTFLISHNSQALSLVDNVVAVA